MRVVVDPKVWEVFVRRCKKRYPHEYVEALWGVETEDTFRIVKFYRIKTDATTPLSIDYGSIEVARQKHLAKKAGLMFLGTAHTHPDKDLDTCPSTLDHSAGHKDGERIMGIVHLVKLPRKKGWTVDAAWWFPQKPLEFVLAADETQTSPNSQRSSPSE